MALHYINATDYNECIDCVPDQGNGIDQIILAQLTQLYMTLKLECPFYEVRVCHIC